MARNPKDAENLQVFRGSLSKPDVFSANAGDGCCGTGTQVTFDKLGIRTRFDNALAHSNPLGANDKYRLPYGNGFDVSSEEIIAHINEFGAGASISVLAIPTYAFVTGVAVHTYAEEEGLAFELVTRNGLVLPDDFLQLVTVAAGPGGSLCDVTRTAAAGAYTAVGILPDGALNSTLIGRSALGEFSLEADELILRVVSMPASGVVNGTFDIEVAVSYEVVKRAEM